MIPGYIEIPAVDDYAFMDRYISTARHMLGFDCPVAEIRAVLVDEGASEYQAFLSVKAAVILNNPVK